MKKSLKITIIVFASLIAVVLIGFFVWIGIKKNKTEQKQSTDNILQGLIGEIEDAQDEKDDDTQSFQTMTKDVEQTDEKETKTPEDTAESDEESDEYYSAESEESDNEYEANSNEKMKLEEICCQKMQIRKDEIQRLENILDKQEKEISGFWATRTYTPLLNQLKKSQKFQKVVKLGQENKNDQCCEKFKNDSETLNDVKREAENFLNNNSTIRSLLNLNSGFVQLYKQFEQVK